MARPRRAVPATPAKTTLRAEVRELRVEIRQLRLDQRQTLEALRLLLDQGHRLPHLLRNAQVAGLVPLPATVVAVTVDDLVDEPAA